MLKKKTLDGNLESLILAVLEDGETYGYRLIEQLNELGHGHLKLGEGSIYPVLQRLESRGLVKPTWRVGDNGRRRKYYRLTRPGVRALADNLSLIHI